VRYLFFFFIFCFASCQNYNSSSADESRFSESDLPPAPSNNPQDPAYQSYVKFVKSYNIIKTRCFQCHTGDFANLVTNEMWVDSGFVVKNDVDNSSLINRLKNFSPPGDMPTGGSSSIPSTEYTILRDWIETMP
jgi:hypothetical protein